MFMLAETNCMLFLCDSDIKLNMHMSLLLCDIRLNMNI